MEGLVKLLDHIPKMKTYGLETNLFHITHNNLSPKKLMFVMVISIPYDNVDVFINNIREQAWSSIWQ